MPKLAVDIIFDSRRHMDRDGRTWSVVSILLHLTVALSLAMLAAYAQHRRAMQPRVYRVSIAALPGDANANLSRSRQRPPATVTSKPAPITKSRPQPPTPAAKKTTHQPQPKPKETPVVGIQPKKTVPQKKPVPRVLEDAPIRNDAGPAKKAGTAGSTPRVGFTSQGTIFDVDGANFAYSYYLGLVQNRIGSNWVRSYVGKGKVKIYFRIQKNGHVESAIIETSSGDPGLDRLALRAVMASDPLPPLPEGYTGSVLGIHIWFNYEE